MARAWIEIPLGGRKYAGHSALIDVDDYGRVNAHHWHACRYRNKFYAIMNWYRDGKHTSLKMHKFLTNFPQTDHANGDGLDNRRSNLRPATSSQNQANKRGYGKSQYLGVAWDQKRGCWQAGIMKDYRRYYLGFFDSEEDAARAYDEAARKIHGEFARPNFPEEQIRV